jgi:WD40 repeat protein
MRAAVSIAEASAQVWDTRRLHPLAVLNNVAEGGVTSIAFSHSGEHIATIGMDADHTIAVWRWQVRDTSYKTIAV